MKFLLTVHQFFPEHFSGTEVLTLSVAKELLLRGHEVSVYTGFPAKTQLPDSARFDEYRFEGIRVFRFHHAWVPMGGQTVVTTAEYNNLLSARYFARLLDEVKPDIVHFFHLSRLSSSLIDVVTSAGISAYYTPTDFWSVCPTSQLLLGDGQVCSGPSKNGGNCVKHVAELTRGPRIANVARLIPTQVADVIVKLAINNFLPDKQICNEIASMGQRKDFIVRRLNALHGVVSPTKLMTDVLIANGLAKELITQSAYGIDVGHYDGVVKNSAEGKVTFGFIGTLAPHKGCKVLIDAFHKLNSSAAKLKIYGSAKDFPQYYSELENAADNSDLIEFCGTFPNAQIAEVLSGIDVLVVPSLWYENTPLVVYSALAAKCPVLASDFPGMSEVVKHGINGMVFQPGNVERLAERLVSFVRDRDLVKRLSNNCESPKSTAQYVDELLELYLRAGSITLQKKNYGLQEIQPFDDISRKNYLSGWMVLSGNAPSELSLFSNGELIGTTKEFTSRPDVKAGLAKNGVPTNTDDIGFIITFLDCNINGHLLLRAQLAGQDEIVDVQFDQASVGTSLQLSAKGFVGFDEFFLKTND